MSSKGDNDTKNQFLIVLEMNVTSHHHGSVKDLFRMFPVA